MYLIFQGIADDGEINVTNNISICQNFLTKGTAIVMCNLLNSITSGNKYIVTNNAQMFVVVVKESRIITPEVRDILQSGR